MMTVGITGGRGFVGLHLRFLLHRQAAKFVPLFVEKEDFLDPQLLCEKLERCDVLVHLAGMNRGDDRDIYETNLDLTKILLASLERIGKHIKLIFLSSTHNERDTAYGRSKRDCEKLIAAWGETYGAKTTSIVSPNIFGEFGRPHYNSAVATFCHELAQGRDSVVNGSGKVELVYVGQVAALIAELMTMDRLPCVTRIDGRVMTVGGVYDDLKRFDADYRSGIIPLCADDFEVRLFNTFRSFLYPAHFPMFYDVKADTRGTFVEIAKARVSGQASFSTTKPGITRGNHYHTRKIERFSVIQGEGIIRLRRIFSNQVIEYRISGGKPAYVDMPTFYTHSIENIGASELITMFWINEIFNPNDPDTFSEPVLA